MTKKQPIKSLNVLEMTKRYYQVRVDFFTRLDLLSQFPQCREALEKDGFDANNWMQDADALYSKLNAGGSATRDYMILHDDNGNYKWETTNNE